MARWMDLCALEELPVNQGRQVEAGGTLLAVFRLEDGTVRVTDDACPHAGASLAFGMVQGRCVTCPRHYWVFSLDTGKMPDADWERLKVYPVKVENGRVWVEMLEKEAG